MSDQRDYDNDVDEAQETSFVRRWSRRKLEQQRIPRQEDTPAAQQTSAAAIAKAPVNEQDLPSIDEINEDSEISMFLAEGVSEMVRRQALRKLFHLDKFNLVDGLDDYAEDYTAFEPLGKVMTAYQQLREERDKLEQALAEAEPSRPEELAAGSDTARDAQQPTATTQVTAEGSNGVEVAHTDAQEDVTADTTHKES